MTDPTELIYETAKLIALLDKYKNRWISSEQREIHKQKDKVMKIIAPEINKAAKLQGVMFG